MFASSIFQRLLVVFEESLYIHNIRDMKVGEIFILQSTFWRSSGYSYTVNNVMPKQRQRSRGKSGIPQADTNAGRGELPESSHVIHFNSTIWH